MLQTTAYFFFFMRGLKTEAWRINNVYAWMTRISICIFNQKKRPRFISYTSGGYCKRCKSHLAIKINWKNLQKRLHVKSGSLLPSQQLNARLCHASDNKSNHDGLLAQNQKLFIPKTFIIKSYLSSLWSPSIYCSFITSFFLYQICISIHMNFHPKELPIPRSRNKNPKSYF